MSLTMSATLAAAWAAATTRTAQCNALVSALGASRTLVCSLSGVPFIDVDLAGTMTVAAGEITNFGLTSNVRTQLAATLVGTTATLRISGGGQWVEGSLGLTGSGADFTVRANPTTSSGVGFASTCRIRGNSALPVGAESPKQLIANGVWTWFTDQRAIYRNGATYIGWVDSAGSCGVSKYTHATGVAEDFRLSAVGLELDDHNNTGLVFLPDGRLLCLYCRHGDTSHRYRISTSPESVTAFSAEALLSVTAPVSYNNTHYLSGTGRVYLHYRSGVGGTGTNPMNVRAFDPTAGTWDAQRTWITQTGSRPYVKSCNNGVDRIDFLFTNCHPNEGAASIYHCYMKLDAGVEKFYTSTGVLIEGDVTPAKSTLIYDGSTVDGWVWSITYGTDGHPRVLFTRYPSTNDHRYMFSRWTGAAWTTPVEVTPAGTYLYAGEPTYSGGICFDSQNPDRIYLSKQISGTPRELQEWRTADNGATWAKYRDITTDSGVRNCRPFSPKNHNGEIAVLWWRGVYNTYTDYNTAIWGAA